MRKERRTKGQQTEPRRRVTDTPVPVRRATYNNYYGAGSDSSAAESRQRLRPQESVDMKARRKGTTAFRSVLFWAVGALLAGGLIWNLTVASDPSVTIIGTPDERVFMESKDVYQKAVSEQLAQFKWGLDTSHIREELLKQFPELGEVEITVPAVGRQVSVALTPASPAFVVVNNEGTSLVVNGEGRAISSDVTKTTNLPMITDQTGLSFAAGDQIFGRSETVFIQEVLRQLEAKDIAVAALTLPAVPSRLHVTLQDAPYYIMLTLQNDAAQQLGAFFAARDRLAQENRTPAEYIDVRIADRVYVR